VDSCEHTDMTSVNNDLQTCVPVWDDEGSDGEKRELVYFLLSYLETPGRNFDNEYMPLNL